MTTETTGSPLIVVGVDGSGSSLDALVWAVRQARLTGARLRLVTCWRYPRPFGYDLGYEDWRPDEDAIHVQEQALASLGDSLADVTTESRIVEGEPARVLVEEAKAADLLVVGSRGHRELMGMLLGSVSEFCAAHASCPVVVVHEGERAAEWLELSRHHAD
jgi:nucleotide-binding universal stress UspA family protein